MVYIVSPVDYVDEGRVDRAYEPTQFRSLEEAEEFIAALGSRWCLYPNIEILKAPNWVQRLLGHNELRFIKGYDECCEYI